MKRMIVHLIGRDLPNGKMYLHSEAFALLAENGIENFLAADDFVFMMSQGYILGYFKANGNPNLILYGFEEGNNTADSHGNTLDFVKKIMSGQSLGKLIPN